MYRNHMLDKGEVDDKLIAVMVNNSIFSSVDSFNELKKSYQGITEILEIWFTNYKGSKKIVLNGFENEQKALEIFKNAREQYKKHNDKN